MRKTQSPTYMGAEKARSFIQTVFEQKVTVKTNLGWTYSLSMKKLYLGNYIISFHQVSQLPAQKIMGRNQEKQQGIESSTELFFEDKAFIKGWEML